MTHNKKISILCCFYLVALNTHAASVFNNANTDSATPVARARAGVRDSGVQVSANAQPLFTKSWLASFAGVCASTPGAVVPQVCISGAGDLDGVTPAGMAPVTTLRSNAYVSSLITLYPKTEGGFVVGVGVSVQNVGVAAGGGSGG